MLPVYEIKENKINKYFYKHPYVNKYVDKNMSYKLFYVNSLSLHLKLLPLDLFSRWITIYNNMFGKSI